MTRASLIFAEQARRLIGSRGTRRSSFDEGLRDIRREDAGFDPTRFVGYVCMVFRQTQQAWMSRDLGSLRDRVTRELHNELQTRSETLRGRLLVNRIEEVEITAAVTEACQEDGRDYVTAHITGSLLDYTIDEVAGGVVEGSRTVPRAVAEFWTFTCPAGMRA